MKKISIVVYSAFVLIMLVNVIFYLSLYNNQIEYSIKILDRQVRIVGSDVDNTNLYLISDLTEIDFSDDVSRFFTDNEVNQRAKEKIKLYYSKYEDLIVGFMIYNTAGDVYTLFKDNERNLWLDGTYRAQNPPRIYMEDHLESDRDKYKFYLPILKEGQVLGNFVITMDFKGYFSSLFAKYNLEEYQWQWLVNDSGVIVLDNHGGDVEYSQLRRINDQLNEGVSGRLTHQMKTDGLSSEIISAFYPVSIVGLNYGIVFSAPTDFFQKYIVRNALLMGILTMTIILLIIILFQSHYRRQKRMLKETRETQDTLNSIVDQMPAGIIIYDSDREIVKVNQHAAHLFSYENGEEMTGKLIPDLSRNEYVSGMTGQLGNGRIIRIQTRDGDRIVFRNSTPISYGGENDTLDVFIDVTALESARKDEERANIAKSELLERMSFEIRTPLNGIVGMTEMLYRSEMSQELKEITQLLRRSADLLLTIVNDIFDVSKVETGRMILDEVPFRLREEITYCMNLIRRENPDSMVRFISNVSDDVPENLIGDPYRLRQAITNLFNNALSGTVLGEIRLGCISKKLSGNAYSLEFTITDTGRIYSRSELKKLFGDYILGSGGREEWAEDLKLGPVLARQLVELMGGKLTAESPATRKSNGEEAGLTVRFNVNVHLNEKLAKGLNLESYRHVTDIRTLVITGIQSRDDDFLGIIHRLGLPVSVTSYQKNTIQQLKTARQHGPGDYILLIIFDEPDSDGFEIAEALNREGMTGDYIIMMFTSREPKGHYARCVDIGIDHLLVKPFMAEDLLNVLTAHFPALRGTTTFNVDKKQLPSVLVVDDNFLNRKVVGSLLKVMSVPAEYATGGAEAIKMAREKHFDIILMDLIMPEVDGFEAARVIQAENRETVIIALSADTMPETRARVEQSGMKELLTKPVTVDELRKVISRYFKYE